MLHWIKVELPEHVFPSITDRINAVLHTDFVRLADYAAVFREGLFQSQSKNRRFGRIDEADSHVAFRLVPDQLHLASTPFLVVHKFHHDPNTDERIKL